MTAEKRLRDETAMDFIHEILRLDADDWGADTLQRIAEIVELTGRDVSSW